MITGVSGAICGRAAVCRRLPPCRYNGHILHELILAAQAACRRAAGGPVGFPFPPKLPEPVLAPGLPGRSA